jgi:uncharacterized membrane protein
MEKFKSRKFWMAVVSAVLLVLTEGLGMELPIATIVSFASIVIAWIIVEGEIDRQRL